MYMVSIYLSNTIIMMTILVIMVMVMIEVDGGGNDLLYFDILCKTTL